MNTKYLQDTYKLDSRVIEHILDSVENNTEFSEERFEKWLKEKNVAFKSNPSAYVYKYFDVLLEKGIFSRIEYVPNTTSLFNGMREKGIKVIPNDTMYIDIFFNYLLNKGIVEEAELIELCDKAINYLKLHYPNPTTTQFIDIFKKSKKLSKKTIDYEAIQKETDEANASWDATLLAIQMEG